MTRFQAVALLVAGLWLIAVAIRYRRSRTVLIGGLAVLGALALAAVLSGEATLATFGVGGHELIWTVGAALVWVVVMLALSPLADRIGTALSDKPPTLGAFKAIQESVAKLLAGIAVAWVLGGFLEELVFRGIVLKSLAEWPGGRMPTALADGVAILVAAGGAAIIHLYQGPRAAIIIAQLSALFGLLFVLTGFDLLAVILAHGLYDTIAFVRFATGKSRYAKYAGGEPPAS